MNENHHDTQARSAHATAVAASTGVEKWPTRSAAEGPRRAAYGLVRLPASKQMNAIIACSAVERGVEVRDDGRQVGEDK